MTTSARMLYLIDGHAQIFRAYFAIRGGMNSPVTGEPTQAVFGFTGMLLKLFHEFHPHHVAMAIDTPGKTFRDDMYDQYKATREAPPADLHGQEQRIFDITRMFGIPIFGQTGAEADDIIATIVRKVLSDPSMNDVHIRIVSKDKDLEQLLNDRVTMFDIHTDTTIDVAWLKENKGITPAQVVDVLALMGDSVDNVPGVPGLGPKTASKLICEFGSIDGMLANIDKITGKRRENIEAGRDKLALSRKLVTLKNDLTLDFSLLDTRVGSFDVAGLKHVFHELGFRRHITELERLAGPSAKTETQPAAMLSKPREDADGFRTSLFDDAPAAIFNGPVILSAVDESLTAATQYDYRGITTREQLDELVRTLREQPLISLDTETTSLGRDSKLCGLSFAWKAGSGVYVPILSPTREKHLDCETVLAALRPILEGETPAKCGHNLKFDLGVLLRHGVHVRGVVFDSMIASHLVGSDAHNLDYLAEHVLKHRMIPIRDLIGDKGKGQDCMDNVPLELVVPYAAEDADMALRLCEHFRPRLKAMGMNDLVDVEMPLVEVLAVMESHGITVDPNELAAQQKDLAGRIVELRQRVFDAVGEPFNIDSPKQLGDILFKKLGLPVVKKTRTGPSTDIEVLEKLAELENLTPEQALVPKLVVEYRQLAKLVNTYLENLRECIDPLTHRVHATFNQTGAATGRLSSNSPNLQNIPIRTDVGRQIRKAFIAAAGQQLISADYSQIELRVLAHLSDDAGLNEAFEQDQDIHTAVAMQVFNLKANELTPQHRTYAKTINFGIIYGVTPYGLARRIENLDVEGATKLIAEYKRRFPRIEMFLQDCIHQAQQHGYVTTLLGRRRMIPQIKSSNGSTRALGERLAINSVVQGSAADLIKMAMVNLYRQIEREKLPLKLLLQIHDELVLESPADLAHEHAAIVRNQMQNAMKLRVPLKVEVGVGNDWFSVK